MFSLYFDYWVFVILVVFHFGFGGWIWDLIASVPDLCILFTVRSICLYRISLGRVYTVVYVLEVL